MSDRPERTKRMAVVQLLFSIPYAIAITHSVGRPTLATSRTALVALDFSDPGKTISSLPETRCEPEDSLAGATTRLHLRSSRGDAFGGFHDLRRGKPKVE